MHEREAAAVAQHRGGGSTTGAGCGGVADGGVVEHGPRRVRPDPQQPGVQPARPEVQACWKHIFRLD